MEKSSKRSNVNVYIDGSCLIIKISGILTVRTLDAILNGLIEEKEKQRYTITDMILDLSDVYPVKIGGATGLVCLCSALMTNKMEEITSPSNFYIRRPSERVLSYLVTLGFFTHMSNKAKLLGCEDLVVSESERKQHRRKKQIRSTFDDDLNDGKHPIVWPMETIQRKDGSIADKDFENSARNFVNHARDHFEKLFSSSYFNFNGGDIHDFWLANYELYVNIFEHSNSWGLGAIHARPGYGTAVCYYDIGIGFKGSANASPKIEEKFKTDSEAMNWALEDGHSSKPDRNGYGLTIVQDFVLSRKNGIIEIRSGKCLFQRKPGDTDWRPQEVPWFHGVQISFFVPCQQ